MHGRRAELACPPIQLWLTCCVFLGDTSTRAHAPPAGPTYADTLPPLRPRRCTDALAPLARAVVVRFKSIGSAPIMKNNVFKVTAGNKFQAVIVFLRGQLGVKAGDSLVSPRA